MTDILGLVGTPGPSHDLVRVLSGVDRLAQSAGTRTVRTKTNGLSTRMSTVVAILLDIVDCEFGFVAESLLEDGGSFLRILGWHDTTASNTSVDDGQSQPVNRTGLILRDNDSLYGWVHSHATPLISNDPEHDPRCSHSTIGQSRNIKNFCGIPIYADGVLLGIIALVNRVGGFAGDEDVVLAPFVSLVSLIWRTAAHLELEDSRARQWMSVTSVARQREVWTRSELLWSKVSHDLNGIFAVVAMQSELLRMKSPAGSDILPALDRIDTALSRLNEYTARLDLLGRLAEDDSPFANVVDSCLSVVFALQLVEPPGVKIMLEQNIVEDRQVALSARELQALVGSILQNACEAVRPAGDVSLQVNEDEERNLVISVSDSGPGFDDRVLRCVFTRPVTTKSERNRGYGLLAAATLARRGGGEVRISQSSSGSLVSVILPAGTSQT